MDTKHFRALSKKWAFKLREDARDIEQEIILFYLARQAENKNLDIFRPGHEGALFELLKHKIRGNNLESLGGSGRRLGGVGGAELTASGVASVAADCISASWPGQGGSLGTLTVGAG